MIQISNLHQVKGMVLTQHVFMCNLTIRSVFVIDVHCLPSHLTSLCHVFILPQGKQYWRFDGDVLDENYPRDISVGFDGIPDDADASFALPAPSHRAREKAYFFKGNVTGMCGISHYSAQLSCLSSTSNE